MSDQTPVNRLERIPGYQSVSLGDSSPETGGVRRLLADITELVELQGRLVIDDAKCLADATIRPVILGSVSLVLVIAALPCLILAAANLLVEQLDWSPAAAQFCAAGVTILIAVVLSLVAAKGFAACGSPLGRSVGEFEKNMDTIREMLGGRSALQSQLAKMERDESRN